MISSNRSGVRRRPTVAAALAITVVVAAGAWWVLRPKGSNDALNDLLASLERRRIVDARLTGAVRFVPAAEVAVRRANTAPLSMTTRAAIAKVEQSAARQPHRASDRHALAIARAIESRFSEAAAILTSLTAEGNAAADVFSDLAAMQLSVGEPRDIASAVTSADRALQRSPRHPAAMFNRALAIERLRLPSQAIAAWRAYLAMDGSSEWADEVRARLARLESVRKPREGTLRTAFLAALDADDPSRARALVDESPQETRELLEDEGISLWAARSAAPDSESVRGVRAMVAVVAALAARSGDPLLEESVKAHLDAPPATQKALQEAHAKYAHGRALYDRYSFAQAAPLFAESGAVLKRHGDPFWRWCDFYSFSIVYHQNELTKARDALLGLDAASKRYGAVRARVAWQQGIIAGSWSRFDEAFTLYRQALTYFQRAGERDNIAAVNALLADNYLLLGAERQAWEAQFEALSVDLGSLRPRRQQLVAFTGMQAAVHTGAPEAGLYFNSAFIEAATRARNFAAVAEGYVQRARLYQRLHACPEAAASLASAATQLVAADESGTVEFIRAQMLLARAGSQECPIAGDRIGPLTTAVESFRSSTRTLWLPRTLLARARELQRIGKTAEAEQDLEQGIAILERSASALGAAALRLEYTDDVWDLFDEMIDVQLTAARPEAAWTFAERGRALIVRGGAAPVTVSDVVSRLPTGHVLLYYAVAKTRIVLFTFDAQGLSLRQVKSEAATLAARVRAFAGRLAAGHDDDETKRLSEQLYEALLAEAVGSLPADTHLHIVADGPLHELPFAALKPRAEERFLFERFLVSRTSSAAGLFAPRPRGGTAAGRRGGAGTALVIGDPTGRDLSGPLPGLPNAAREAATVAKLYDNAQLHLHERATREALFEGLTRADVIHFAGHAVVDERYPELSRLVMASAASREPRSVLMRELADLSMPRTRLVVLAACSTGAGPIFRGPGALSLAWPFVAAGVPTVVSTLWPIDDYAGSRLFSLFHRYATSGMPPVLALRRAQSDVRQDRFLTPYSWAAVSMFSTLAQS